MSSGVDGTPLPPPEPFGGAMAVGGRGRAKSFDTPSHRQPPPGVSSYRRRSFRGGFDRRSPFEESEGPSPDEGPRGHALTSMRIHNSHNTPHIRCDCPRRIDNKRSFGGKFLIFTHSFNCLSKQSRRPGVSYNHTVIPCPPPLWPRVIWVAFTPIECRP